MPTHNPNPPHLLVFRRWRIRDIGAGEDISPFLQNGVVVEQCGSGDASGAAHYVVHGPTASTNDGNADKVTVAAAKMRALLSSGANETSRELLLQAKCQQVLVALAVAKEKVQGLYLSGGARGALQRKAQIDVRKMKRLI